MTRLALLVAVGCLVSVLLIHAQSYNDSELRAFLTPPEGCPAPCFLGIRPGLTTAAEAITMLEAHEWIAGVQLEVNQDAPMQFIYGRLNWNWRENAPGLLDRSQQSHVILVWESYSNREDHLEKDVFVGAIHIFTQSRIYLAQQLLGEPDSGSAGIGQLDIQYTMNYNLSNSPRPTILGLTTRIACPANLLAYWQARAELYETIWLGTGQYLPLREVLKLC